MERKMSVWNNFRFFGHTFLMPWSILSHPAVYEFWSVRVGKKIRLVSKPLFAVQKKKPLHGTDLRANEDTNNDITMGEAYATIKTRCFCNRLWPDIETRGRGYRVIRLCRVRVSLVVQRLT